MTEGKTKPPARFNEGTLLAAMENPTQFMARESKDLIKTIGEYRWTRNGCDTRRCYRKIVQFICHREKRK